MTIGSTNALQKEQHGKSQELEGISKPVQKLYAFTGNAGCMTDEKGNLMRFVN